MSPLIADTSQAFQTEPNTAGAKHYNPDVFHKSSYGFNKIPFYLFICTERIIEVSNRQV